MQNNAEQVKRPHWYTERETQANLASRKLHKQHIYNR